MVLRITKIRSFRFNFQYGDKHYSIQQADESEESLICLRCLEDKSEIDKFSTCFPSDFYYPIIGNPGCYKHYQIDIAKINRVFGTQF